ncbi:hypothetical protein WN944_010827 [Citrus x changshan-huyou]|uniref:Uncharacterized protein n=1 Tax=Citrus x changshan-huyou TaxID=2935761 RepID=A0AAP0MY77_9ROSI
MACSNNSIVACNGSNDPLQRRSANYHASIWNPELIESFTTPYTYELYANRLDELKQKAKDLFASAKESTSELLKLTDSVQKLGVAYHFEEEIKEAMNILKGDATIKDLNATSLHFRLLREYGHPVSTGTKRDGRFHDNLREDIEGLLSLFEASFLGIEGEDVLEEANIFCTEHLKESLGTLGSKIILAEQVKQSLDIPSYWRIPRIEAQNFIKLYPTDDESGPILLTLAKLDYNLVQSIHQQELKELARWWSNLGFKEKLSFARDRLMENYLLVMGLCFEAQFSKCRIGLTKFVCILTAIDDMYDVYGSIDELELFTEAVKRWEIGAVLEELPEYMQICYLAMFNFGNELAYDVMKIHGLNTLSYIKKEWENLCTSYLVEARWFSKGYTPTAKEYIENAWVSVGSPAAIVHAYILLQLQGSNDLTENSLSCLKVEHGYDEMIYWSSLISRLSNDLGNSAVELKRGDVAKSIQCYMIEEGISEEEARDRIKSLIIYSWKKLNGKNLYKSDFPESMAKMCLDMSRTAHCIFHGDGIGTSTGVTRDRLVSLILEPIPVEL